MRVVLAGPDDLGYWFLEDEDGNSFPLVNCEADHITAAVLFGWKAPEEGAADQEAIIEEARLWLMDCIGDQIEAPKDAADFFQELYEEQESE
jgi:hypothetical protein